MNLASEQLNMASKFEIKTVSKSGAYFPVA